MPSAPIDTTVPTSTNPFEILGLDPRASPEEIKRNYHRLAKIWHPHCFEGADKALAESKFRQVVEAFLALQDPAQRRAAVNTVAESAPKTRPPQAPEPPVDSLERKPEDWFQEALEAMKAGEKEWALGLVHVALRGDPQRAEFHVLHGELLLKNGGDRRQATHALETALKLEANNADVMIKLAELYRTAGMPTRASALLKKAREIAPNHKFFRLEDKRAKVLQPPDGLGEQIKNLVRGFRNWTRRGSSSHQIV